ncbi:hypothetical protein AC529_09255 [Thermobifida cellulosilytica TB100]|uniref:Uncharacterized protein n=1 Tax=Thermobifida cellulosilytica TB100 TaxID=665004 RepID=A0A147KI71_THECS|nr:hypothetical protein AC529_09255 [Thermobifida cellulosilytica TB100]
MVPRPAWGGSSRERAVASRSRPPCSRAVVSTGSSYPSVATPSESDPSRSGHGGVPARAACPQAVRSAQARRASRAADPPGRNRPCRVEGVRPGSGPGSGASGGPGM